MLILQFCFSENKNDYGQCGTFKTLIENPPNYWVFFCTLNRKQLHSSNFYDRLLQSGPQFQVDLGHNEVILAPKKISSTVSVKLILSEKVDPLDSF